MKKHLKFHLKQGPFIIVYYSFAKNIFLLYIVLVVRSDKRNLKEGCETILGFRSSMMQQRKNTFVKLFNISISLFLLFFL